MKVTANFSDGRTVAWDDGTVTGDPARAEQLDDQRGIVLATAEGPAFDAREWRSSAYAFIAAMDSFARWNGIEVRLDSQGVPPLERPAGVF